MQALLDAIKSHAGAMDGQAPVARYGTVQSVSAMDCTVRVLLQPEAVLSGWLPVLSLAAGAGWGVVALPGVGQQVLLLSEYGDAASGVVVGAAYSKGNAPPDAAPGEIVLRSEAGAVLRLRADGTIRISAASIQVVGDVVVQGDVADRHGSLDRLRQAFNAHVHGGVQAGAGVTAPPTITDAG